MTKLFSNAPKHWPLVKIHRLSQEKSPTAIADNNSLFVQGLSDALADTGSYISEIAQPKLVAGGVLEIPALVRGPDGEFAAFFYPEANEFAAAHFVALSALTEREPTFKPLFFAPGDLLEVYPEEIPQVFNRDKLYLERLDKAPIGQYAIWWSEHGESLSGTKTEGLLEKIFSRADGFESLLAAQILHELGMASGDTVELPQSMLSIAVSGPERIPMIVSFSLERGVRFHFHITQTTPAQRDLFLEHLLAYVCENLPELYFLEKTENDAGSALKWWMGVQKRLNSMTVIDVKQTMGGSQKAEPSQLVLGAMHR